MGFFLFDAATFIASYAFPILPYELFLIMPWALAYFAEGGRVQLFTLKIETLVVFMTYWGAIYGGGVHTLALTAVVGTGFKTENLGLDGSVPAEGMCVTPTTQTRSLLLPVQTLPDPLHGSPKRPSLCARSCSALPPPTPGPWCVLLMAHVFLMLPMGYFFIYLALAEAKKFGAFLTFSGDNPRAAFYERAAFYFIVGGISGNLPYFGQIGIQGTDVFAGPGVYTDNGRLPSWYNGRGFIEFGAYSSWLIGGLYFLVKACIATKGKGKGSSMV